MNNSTNIILGVIVGLVLGGFGGYTTGQKSSATINAAQVQQMTDMMKADGERMEKMGGMMMSAGTIMQEKGTTYKDDAMLMMGKDLGANGKKHMEDGKSMTEGDMMGMMTNGNMQNMPGMDMDGMKM
jgi:hypothetical protein